MIEFLNEFFFGKFTNFNRALKYPKKVKVLKLQLFDDNFNNYKSHLKLFQNLIEINIHTSINHSNVFPDEFSELTNLKKITILNYPLIEFPRGLEKLQNLKFLKIRGSEIEKFPVFEFNAFQNLKTLAIENCELKKIPEFISSLKNIEVLSFAETKIKSISEIKLPAQIKSLDLGATMVQVIEQNDLPKSLVKLNLCGSSFNFEQSKVSYHDIKKLEVSLPNLKINKVIY